VTFAPAKEKEKWGKRKAEIVSRGDRKERQEDKIGIFLACLAILAREKSGFSDFTRRRGGAEEMPGRIQHSAVARKWYFPGVSVAR
jgi:hypothetical protein